MGARIVPRDLLDGLALNRHKRLVVLGWLLSSGPDTDGPALARAHDLIPPDLLRANDPSPELRTVAAVLIDLRNLGLVTAIRLRDDGYFEAEATG